MTKEELIRPSSVILVSGGARGITAQCVIKLAERAHCKFILLGRSSAEGTEPAGAAAIQEESALKQLIMEDLKEKGEKPTLQKVQRAFKSIITRREIKETLEAVRMAGGQAEYLRVDITNRDDLQDKLAEPVHRNGPITGIIHGAGNLADKLIEKKSVDDYETVFSTKIDGLQNLLASVPLQQLDFLVLFSSIVGFYGNVGQADYAMANEILNKTAHLLKMKNPDCHIISIGWGPWDSGMVTPELKKAFEDRNVRVIPADAGAAMLVDELLPSASTTTQVVVGDAPPRPEETGNPDLLHYEVRRILSLDANPFLQDHRIGDNAVLPATCAATWVASVCEHLYPNHTFFSIDTYKVLKGIVFDSNLASEYVLDLKEIAKSPEGDVDFDALIWSKNKNGRTVYNYSLRARLVKTPPQVPIDRANIQVTDHLATPIIGQTLYNDGTLFHGPSFQGVERVFHVSESKLIMQVSLPHVDQKVQGQFPVQTGNPFIYDAIVQGILIWAQVYYQAPCLPAYVEHLEQYKAIPFDEPLLVTLEIKSQSETSVIGDLTVQDPEGGVYVNIIGLRCTISTRLNHMIGVRQKSQDL